MKVIYWSIIGICLFGCNKEARLAEVPIYLSIPSVKVSGALSQDPRSHFISEIWIYADSLFIGAYPVPARVPIIPTDQQTDIDLFPGIRENGQASVPLIYPFYQAARITLKEARGGEQEVTPEFGYLNSAQVALDEDFESSNVFREDLDGDNLTAIEGLNQGSLDGRAGVAYLTADHEELEVASVFPLERLPTNGSAVFLELDYRSDVGLAVGLRGQSALVPPVSSYKIVLFESSERQKIYINFSPDLQASALASYQILFRAFYNANLQLDTQYVYLDNIKLLHF